MKRLVTAASALAIAVTSMAAAPAAAQDNSDRSALGLVLGLAAVGIIAHELDKDRDDDREESKRDRNYYSDNRYRDDRYYHYDDRHDGRHDNRHDNRSDRARLIPRQCVVETRTGGRRTHVVSEQCFRRVQGKGLPGACQFQIRTDRGRQDVYGVNCLRDRGYRVASR
jgi:hypothetical protein